MDEKRKPGFGFWLTIVLLVVVVVYPLSFGPAVWILEHSDGPEWLGTMIGVVYTPLEAVCGKSPHCIRAFEWYLSFWIS